MTLGPGVYIILTNHSGSRNVCSMVKQDISGAFLQMTLEIGLLLPRCTACGHTMYCTYKVSCHPLLLSLDLEIYSISKIAIYIMALNNKDHVTQFSVTYGIIISLILDNSTVSLFGMKRFTEKPIIIVQLIFCLSFY